MSSQCKKVLRDGESSKKTRKNPGVRKAQQQQSRFRALREELQGPPSRTRASLKRRLQEPSSSSKFHVEKKRNQEDCSRNGDITHAVEPKENPGTDARAPDTEEPLGAPSVNQSLPDRQTLELTIDILQRKDTYEIFAEPVDPEEVEDYYEIIEEPMDFGTMRAKLHEGMYTSLKQFEHDVFLISGNAMHFNSSGTIFFRQAHAIHKLAKRVFHVLRTNPENFESEFSGTRRRSCRRSQDEFSSRTSEKTRGSGDGKMCDYNEEDRRSTYKPDLDLNNDKSLKSLVYLNQQDHSYQKSLMQFVKGLGPTAHMVAKRKLQRLFEDASISHQTTRQDDPQIPFGQTKNLILFGSRHSVLNDGRQDSSVLGIMKTDTQNRVSSSSDQYSSSSVLTSQGLRTSNGTDYGDQSSRSSGNMESVVTSTRGLCTRAFMPHAALDLGFLKSKMHGEDEWWRRC